MKKHFIIPISGLIIFLILLFIHYSCRKDKYVVPICYDTDIQPILTSKCTMSGCHNGIDKAEGLDLTSYNAFLNSEEKDEILKVINKGKMPPSGYVPLTLEEKEKIKRWAALNYGKGDCNINTSTACDTTNVTYTNTIKPIFDTYCVGCHNVGNASGGYALDTYVGSVNCANSGRLMGSIQWLTGYSTMPKGDAKLSDCNIAKIQKWINSGKPN